MEFDSLTHYSLLKTLNEKGKGAYGSVFTAEVEGIDVKTICKRLHPAIMSPHNIKKFMTECITLSQLKHRNCVKFWGVNVGPEGSDKGDINLIMELLPFDLDEVATEANSPNFRPEISFIRKISIMRDVACGLAYLHRRSIIHRDLTPRKSIQSCMHESGWHTDITELVSTGLISDIESAAKLIALPSPITMN